MVCAIVSNLNLPAAYLSLSAEKRPQMTVQAWPFAACALVQQGLRVVDKQRTRQDLQPKLLLIRRPLCSFIATLGLPWVPRLPLKPLPRGARDVFLRNLASCRVRYCELSGPPHHRRPELTSNRHSHLPVETEVAFLQRNLLRLLFLRPIPV